MKDNKLDVFFETSAKTGSNVKAIFQEAAARILKKKSLTTTLKAITQQGVGLQKQTQSQPKSVVRKPSKSCCGSS